MTQRDGLASVNLESAKAIGQRLVTEGRYENLAEACRVGLRRLEKDALVVDRLVDLAEEGLRSGIDDGFDIDAFIEQAFPAA